MYRQGLFRFFYYLVYVSPFLSSTPFFFKIMNNKTQEIIMWSLGVIIVAGVMICALLPQKQRAPKYNQNFLRNNGLAELDSRYINKPRFLRFVDVYGVPWKGTICGWTEIKDKDDDIK